MLTRDKQYKVKEHYVPRFILRNFVQQKLLTVADVSTKTVRYFQTTPENVCFQNDLYEIKNANGTYFNRNELEDRFADMERWFAPQIQELFLYSDQLECLSSEQDVMLALLFAVQLVRTPAIKEQIYDKDTIGLIEKNYIYQAFVNSHETAIEYLKKNFANIPAGLLQDSKEITLVDKVASRLLSTCFFYVIDASNSEGEFFIADQPVLITPFEDAQYIFPVSPDFAVACCSFDSAHGRQVESLVEIDEEMVHKINVLSYKQAKRFVIAKEFMESHKRIMEGKDDK